MHQSRKEQGMERMARGLLQPDRREASMVAELETDIEAAEEWGGKGIGLHARRAGSGRLL